MEDYEAAEVAVAAETAEAAAAAAAALGGCAGGSKNAEFQFDSMERVLGRRCIWSHHICCPFKRRYMQQCARCVPLCAPHLPLQCASCHCNQLSHRAASELRLGGWSKIGFPGVIVVEGGEM